MNSKKPVAESEFSQVCPNGRDLQGASEFSRVSGARTKGDFQTALERVVIRKAEQADCKRMLELVRELAVYEKAPDEVTVTLEHFTNTGFGEKPVWRAFVAASKDKDGEMIVGFALYYIRFSTWKGQQMYLEDFIVTEQARGKGIGKLLFDKLVEEAKQEKFCSISWQVLHWNESAINFYKKYYNASIEKGWLNCSLKIENF